MPDIDLKTVMTVDGDIPTRVGGVPDNVTRARLVGHLNVLDYGAGINAAGDTAAFQAVIDIAAAQPEAGRQPIYFPAGEFEINAALTGVPTNLYIRGAGEYNTLINFTASGDAEMFTLGTFDATPAPAWWSGAASGLTIRDLRISGSAGVEGSRVHTCIQDNGSGGVRLHRVRIDGFKHGFWAPYGSDFTCIVECDLFDNDVATYFGPYSWQIELRSTKWYGNREDLVIEGEGQGNAYGCWFIDALIANVVFERNTTTRAGVTPTDVGYQHAWQFDGCWFESDANTGQGRIPPRIVWFSSNTPDTDSPSGVAFHNTLLMGGGASDGTRSFVQMDSGGGLSIENTRVGGLAYTYLVYMAAGISSSVNQYNTRGSAITAFGGQTNNCRYLSRTGEVKVGADLINYMMRLNASLDSETNSIAFGNDGAANLELRFWSGSAWLNRVTVDVQNSKVVFPEQTASIGGLAANVVGTGTDDSFRTGLVATGSRPGSPAEGDSIWDSTLNLQIWWNGTTWQDGAGTTV